MQVKVYANTCESYVTAWDWAANPLLLFSSGAESFFGRVEEVQI